MALAQDLTYALRVLRKNPGFAAVALATLALGIGGNTAIFSVVDAVLLRPLPYPEANRLLIVWEDAAAVGFHKNTPAPANYLDWKSRNQVFENMAAMRSDGSSLTGTGEPELLYTPKVTASMFPVLGVKPALGRPFTEQEDQAGGPKVAILSHSLWVSRFAGDPNIIGRQILLNDEKREVIGVMPASFAFPDPRAKIWLPMQATSAEWARRGSHYLRVIARLKPGVPVERAKSEMHAIALQLQREHPDSNKDIGITIESLRDSYVGEVRTGLWVLLAAVGLVLLIACANVANLLLAKATARTREIAVRAAVGAGRNRIIAQLLSESMVLAIAGALLGVGLAAAGLRILKRLIPALLAGTVSLELNWRVLAFTVLASCLAALVFGLAPAWSATRLDLQEALKQGGRAVTGRRSRLRDVLVASEVALAMLLLVGAGLLVQTLLRLRSVDLGFRTDRTMTFTTRLSTQRYAGDPARRAFAQQVIDRVRTLPGVQSAAYASDLPLVMKGNTSSFVREGYPPPAVGEILDANYREVSPEYLSTMGVPVLRGRYISKSDGPDQAKAAVVNEAAAKAFWPDRDPVGRRFRFGSYDSPYKESDWIQIVGVVGNMHQMGIDAPPRAEIYVSIDQATRPDPTYLVVRAATDPAALVPAVVREIRAVDPEMPVSGIQSLEEITDAELAQRKMQVWTISIFAAVALGLAAIGIYGVLAFAVVQRTSEIGIRIALGAKASDVVRMIAGRGLMLAVIGVVAGLAASVALTRFITSLLFGVRPDDPATLAAIAAVLLSVALAASVIPAVRAARLDPMRALREE